MWLMDERQKVADLAVVVKRQREDLAALWLRLVEISAQLQRRRDEQIVLEARVDRLEQPPATRARRGIPQPMTRLDDSSSPSAPSDSLGDSS